MSNCFEYLKERGYIYQMTHEEEIRKAINSDTPITFYMGIDPTADSLHIGHFFALEMFRHLQDYGHRGILLIGSATALIGDPTGKSDARKMMTKETVAHNVAEVKSLAKRFIKTDGDNPALILENGDWINQYSYIDFLRMVGIHFNVNKMLASEAYSTRLANGGLTFLEMGYMLMQAYDFVHLNRKYGCTLEIGGSDQWGNIVAGTELSRKMNIHDEGKSHADRPDTYGLTCPLLMTKDGKKMGKTEAGALWVARDRTTPYAFYQYFYNIEDESTEMLLKLFTSIPTADIEDMCKRDIVAAKKRMAFEVTKLVHGEEEAQKAVQASQALFSNGADMSDVPSVTIEKDLVAQEIGVLDFVTRVGFIPSKGEARRLIVQGGLSIDGQRVTDVEQKILPKDGYLLQKGKKTFLRINIQA